MTSLYFGQLILPFRRGLFTCLVTNGTGRRKFVAPLPWAYRLNDHPRVEALLPGLNDRIEGTTPTAPQEIDRCRRIGTSADRPQDFVGISDIDILVNHHDIAA